MRHLVGVSVVTLVLLGCLQVCSHCTTDDPVPPAVEPAGAELPSKKPDPEPGMVFVPAGPYLRATTPAEARAIEKTFETDRPRVKRFGKFVARELVDAKHRKVHVGAFYIDFFEVTNLQYHHFVKATGAEPPDLPRDDPACWRGGRLPGATQRLHVDEVRNWKNFLTLIRPTKKKDGMPAVQRRPGNRVWELLDNATKGLVDKARVDTEKRKPDAAVQTQIVDAVNKMLKGRTFYDGKFWTGISIRARNVAPLVRKGVKTLEQNELERLNRAHLDLGFKLVIEPGQPPCYRYLPVTGITYFAAKACAEWMGKRLPTEAEWEKAARGPADGELPARLFPWGNEPPRDHCNWALFWVDPVFRDSRPPGVPNGLAVAGSFPKGKSPYGVHDMAGNVLEFTASDWGPHPHRPPAVKLDLMASRNHVVVKGGAAGEQFKENLRIGFRYPFGKREATTVLGFRCAKDAKPGQR